MRNNGLIAQLVVLLFLLPVAAGAQQEGQQNETVCVQCHGSQPGRLGEPVGLWRKSVHEENGISCHDCHGGDPTDFANAMSPERGFIGVPAEEEIPGFCGRCHIGVKEDYLNSKHGQALGNGGPQCVTCHGNHAVQRASLDLINEEDCSRCHSYERAKEIRAALAETDNRISGLEQKLEGLHRVGITVKEMKGRVFSLRNQFHQLFHTVDVEKVRSETSRFQNDLDDVAGEIAAIRDELGQRKMWGGVAVVLLIFAGLLFILIRRTYHEEEDHGEP